jgi:CRISPR-associated protein Cas2
MEGPVLYVIAYDLPDDRRRTKVHKILSGFGRWTQYSLFECFLTRKDLVKLQQRLRPYLKPREDSVRFYPVCAACMKRVETIGGEMPHDDVVFIT